MLPAHARLRRSVDIAQVLRRGARHASQHVVLHTLNTGSQDTRFAFAVGRAVGNSVVRHRITRQLRHIAADNLTQFSAGTDVVVRALPACVGASYAELQTSFATALTRQAASHPKSADQS